MRRRDFNLLKVRLFGWGIIASSLSSCISDELIRSLAFQELPTTPLPLGSILAISWTAVGVHRIHLEVSLNAGQDWQTLATQLPTAAEGSYAWMVEGSDNASIIFRITDVDFPAVSATSSTIETQPTLAIPLEDVQARLDIAEAAVFTYPGIGEIVVLTEGADHSSFRVFRTECPHNGCSVSYEPGADQFQCPCHGSVFSSEGCLEQGPAEEGLTTFDAQLVNEQLLLLLETRRVACT